MTVNTAWLDTIVEAQTQLQTARNAVFKLDQLHKQYTDCESADYDSHIDEMFTREGLAWRIAALRARLLYLSTRFNEATERGEDPGRNPGGPTAPSLIDTILEVTCAAAATYAAIVPSEAIR
jgi:hypothetical protein